MCDVDFKKHDKVFEKNVEKLHTRKVISDKLRKSLLKIWDRRDDYHHLNSNIKIDRRTLESLAKEKAHLLVEVESQIFEFRVTNGRIFPKYPKYWKINNNKMDVFLRLEP
jgi:hypothetical protein